MSWHQTIAFPIGGPVCALGIAIMALLARLERKRPHCSVEELVAVESRAEAQANLGRICPRRSRAYWIGVSLTALAMMVVIDAATVVVLVEVGSIIRLLNLLFIPWFIAAVSSILAGLLWRRGRPALGMMLRVLGDLSLMYWVAGPIAFLFFVFCAALQQDLFMGALMGALLLAAVGGQFAFGADAAWLVAATLADQHPKQQSN
jgi:hypothetical protein